MTPLLFPQKRPPSHRALKRAQWARCPECKLSGMGIPVEHAPNGCNGYAPDGDLEPRLFCPLCGLGWHGTDEEVERSTRKEAAYVKRAEREGR